MSNAPSTRQSTRRASSPSPSDPEPQRLGRYELIELVGRGGTAEVYRARVRGPAGFEKQVVLKRILPEFASDPSFVQLLVAEAKVTAALSHPNITQVFELERDGDTWFMAMELVDGIDLLGLLDAAGLAGTGPPPAGVVLRIVADIAKALEYAHSATDANGQPLGIVHRDVSPSNVLLSRHGDVKLTDFGVAYAAVDHALSRDATRIAGKLAYMAPEQLARQPIDSRSDIFGLGVIAFEALTLRRLFAARTPERTVERVRACRVEERLAKHRDLPEWTRTILLRALAKDPDDRYATAGELHEAILDGLFEARIRPRQADLVALIEELAPRSLQGLDGLDGLEVPRAGAPIAAALAAHTLAAEPLAAQAGAVEEPTCVDATLPEMTPGPAPRLTYARPAPSVALGDAVFRLQDDKGGVFGPVTWDNLDFLLRSAAISPQELVSVDGEQWVTVEEISGIRSIEPDLFAAANGPPTWERQLEALGMARLLWDLGETRATGKLTLMRRRAMKQVWFVAGQPVHTSSNLKEELLGPYLVRHGAATEAQVVTAAQSRKSDGAFLGEALVRTGALDNHSLFHHLEAQLHDKLIELFRWRDGWLAFHEDDPAPEGVAVLRADLRRLVAEGVRAHLTPLELRHHFSGRLDYLLLLDAHATLVHHELALTPHEARMAHRLVPGRTLREIVQTDTASTADRVTLARVAFLLHLKGVLGFGPRRG